MCLNLLEMNQDRTELIFFAPKRRAKELTDINISLGGNERSSMTRMEQLLLSNAVAMS
jgi:hypothetical protein